METEKRTLDCTVGCSPLRSGREEGESAERQGRSSAKEQGKPRDRVVIKEKGWPTVPAAGRQQASTHFHLTAGLVAVFSQHFPSSCSDFLLVWSQAQRSHWPSAQPGASPTRWLSGYDVLCWILQNFHDVWTKKI